MAALIALLTPFLLLRACNEYLEHETDLSRDPKYAGVMGRCYVLTTDAIVWNRREYGGPRLSVPPPNQDFGKMAGYIGTVPKGSSLVVSKVIKYGNYEGRIGVTATLQKAVGGLKDVMPLDMLEEGLYEPGKDPLLPCDQLQDSAAKEKAQPDES